MKILSKKISAAIIASALGITCTFALPVQNAAAVDTVGIIGSIIGGALVYRELDSYMDRVNNTEEGRQEYFQKLKEEEGVSDNYARRNQLDAMMSRLDRKSVV